MANIVDNKHTEKGEAKSKKQQRRQSKDFNEIWNVQSEMNVSEDDWDQMFHDWEGGPDTCNQNRQYKQCAVCKKLLENGYAIRKSTGDEYTYEKE